jgi:hypothetical protein
VAAGGYEGNEGRLQGRIGEVGGGDVAFEVVHGNERKPTSVGQTLGRRKADEEGSDQTRTYRDGYAGHLLQGYTRVGECPLHYTVEAFEMGAGCDLGDDAAVAFVLSLRVDDVGESATTAGIEDGGTSVVAGSFDSQDHEKIIAVSYQQSAFSSTGGPLF